MQEILRAEPTLGPREIVIYRVFRVQLYFLVELFATLSEMICYQHTERVEQLILDHLKQYLSPTL